jgi:hypothetical protein
VTLNNKNIISVYIYIYIYIYIYVCMYVYIIVHLSTVGIVSVLRMNALVKPL